MLQDSRFSVRQSWRFACHVRTSRLTSNAVWRIGAHGCRRQMGEGTLEAPAVFGKSQTPVVPFSLEENRPVFTVFVLQYRLYRLNCFHSTANFRPYNYWDLVIASYAVMQHFSAIFIFMLPSPACSTARGILESSSGSRSYPLWLNTLHINSLSVSRPVTLVELS